MWQFAATILYKSLKSRVKIKCFSIIYKINNVVILLIINLLTIFASKLLHKFAIYKFKLLSDLCHKPIIFFINTTLTLIFLENIVLKLN